MPIIDYYRSSIEIFIFIITENNFFLTNKGIKDLFVALLMISKQNYLITGNHVKTSELQTRIIFKCKFADYKCKKKFHFTFGNFDFPWTYSLISTTRWTKFIRKSVLINKSRQFYFPLSSPNFQLNVRTRKWTPLKRGKTTTSFTNLSFSKDIKLVLIKHQQEQSSFYSVLV